MSEDQSFLRPAARQMYNLATMNKVTESVRSIPLYRDLRQDILPLRVEFSSREHYSCHRTKRCAIVACGIFFTQSCEPGNARIDELLDDALGLRPSAWFVKSYEQRVMPKCFGHAVSLKCTQEYSLCARPSLNGFATVCKG